MENNTPLYPLQTGIRHSGHGLGTIVAYNQTVPLSDNTLQHIAETSPNPLEQSTRVLLAGMLNGMYDGNRYPYEIEFDSGYRDVYSGNEITRA